MPRRTKHWVRGQDVGRGAALLRGDLSEEASLMRGHLGQRAECLGSETATVAAQEKGIPCRGHSRCKALRHKSFQLAREMPRGSCDWA